MGCLAWVFGLALVVAAAMALSALVDPFSWIPPIADVFADCPPAVEVNGSCELEDRYPGYWLHALINVAYSVAVLVSLVAVKRAVPELRSARVARFDGGAAVERYRASRERLALVAAVTATLALVPIVVALL
jgi:hypothetical protein